MPANQIAIDIVLLPPSPLADICFSLSRQLTKSGGEGLLSTDVAQPHITLAMAVIESERLGEIVGKLSELTSPFLPMSLISTGIKANQTPENQYISSVQFDKPNNLQALHEAVQQLLNPYYQSEFSHWALHNLPEPHPPTEDYIRHFEQRASHQHYDPHITLGFGHLPKTNHFPKMWEMSKIGIYQLGKNCTCAKLLEESECN